MLAGISVPDTSLVDRTIEYARQKCEPYLFNHVVRSWLFAARIGQLQNTEHDAEVVAVGTLLHDITLNESFAGPRRFEVEGADLARSFAGLFGRHQINVTHHAGVMHLNLFFSWTSILLSTIFRASANASAGVEHGSVTASFNPSSSYTVTMNPVWRVRSSR
jgi:hypothetical protein